MANPPLVTQGINFLKIKSRLNREIRSAVTLSSSIASSAGMRGLNTGTKVISQSRTCHWIANRQAGSRGLRRFGFFER